MSGGTVVSFHDLPKRGSLERKAHFEREREARLAAAVAQGVASSKDEFDRRDEESKAARLKQIGGYERISDVLSVRTFTEWLIRDFIEKHVIAILVGPRGAYKSAVAFDVVMRVAVLLGLPVLLISAEGPLGVQRRAQAWLDEFDGGLTDSKTIPLYVRRRRVNLSSKEHMETVAAWRGEIEKETGKPVALIVVDTLRKNSQHKENDNDETSNLIGAIDNYLRHHSTQPTTCLLVHHTGHSDQTRGRGASSLAADTDAEYVVSLDKGVVTVTRERFKDSPALPPLYFTPKIRTLNYTDPEGKPVTSVVMMPSSAPTKAPQNLRETQAELLDHVTKRLAVDGKPLSIGRIMDGLDEKVDTVKRRLKTLTDRSLLMCEGGLYSVPPSIVNDPEGF